MSDKDDKPPPDTEPRSASGFGNYTGNRGRRGIPDEESEDDEPAVRLNRRVR